MRFAVKGLAWTMAAVIALSVTVGNNAASIVGSAGLVVTMLGTVVQRSAPTTRSGQERHAHRATFLARYDDPAPARSFAAAILAALAANEVAVALGVPLAAAAVPIVVVAVAYAVLPGLLSSLLGVAGVMAALAGAAVEGEGCRQGLSTLGWLMFVGVIIAASVVVGVVRLGLLPVPPPLSDRVSSGMFALIGFGLVDVALFVARPSGLDVWSTAPLWAAGAVGLLMVVVAALASFAPAFVLTLTAMGAAVAQISLWSGDIGAPGCGGGEELTAVLLFSAVGGLGARWLGRRGE